MATNPSRAREAASLDAFERLYRRHRGDVYRSVLRDVRNPADAEDVTQAAFLNAYRALQGGSEPEKPRAWLLTIAQNVTRRSFRARASRPREVELEVEAVAALEPEGPSAADIRDALARLRPNQRAAIVLREIGGLSYAEIAETLELSVAAVETLLFRARRSLREELEAVGETPVVRVGGIAVWPLSAALSEAAAPVSAWVASRGLAAKVAGAVGAAIVGTGVVVQSAALPATGGDGGSAPKGAVAATPLAVVEAPAARTDPPTPAAKKEKRARTDVARRAGGAPGGTEDAAAPEPESGGALVAAELPVVGEAVPELPEVSVPSLPVELPAPLPVEVPEVTLPDAELPTLPDVELTPPPEADELLP